MDKNYFVDGDWFEDYQDAKDFADILLDNDGIYRSVYTKKEMDSQVKGMVDSIINHEMECGK
jgi:hypothetical protein